MRELYSARLLMPGLYQITECVNPSRSIVEMYLVLGQTQAALVDSGFGVADTLRSFVQKLTDKPIICLVGHGHPDHAGAAGLFDKIYMNSRDEGLLPVSLSYDRRMGDVFGDGEGADPEIFAYCKEHIVPAESFHYENMDDGDVFDLGGTVLEVFAIPGHTQGSVAFYNRAQNYALISDAFSYRSALVTLPPEKRLGITAYRDGIARFLNTINEETLLYWGHGEQAVSHSIPKDMMQACTEVLEGQTGDDVPSNSPFAKRLSAKSGKKMMEHRCGSVLLVYDANTL